MSKIKAGNFYSYTLVYFSAFLFSCLTLIACSDSVSDTLINIEITETDQSSSAMQIEFSVEELADISDYIVTGTVINHHSYWTDDNTSIFTNYIICVKECIVMKEINELVIKEPGGTVGEITEQVGNGLTLSDEEKVLLFLKLNHDCTYSVIGGFQGKYTLDNEYNPTGNGDIIMDIENSLNSHENDTEDQSLQQKQDDCCSECCDQETASSSSAMQIELSLQDLISAADTIVIGMIKSHQSRWNDDNTNIYTYHKLAVERTLKLANCKELVVREPGGIVGDIAQGVGDGAGLSDGENVLLFLKDNQDCTFSIIGGQQGKYLLNENFESEESDIESLVRSIK